MITDKENIYRMYRGEMPAYLPRHGMAMTRSSVFPDVKKPGYHVDEWGTEHIGKDGIFGGTPIPYPGRFLLHDITKWRDVIHAPSLDGVDWEMLAKKDLENIDRDKIGITMWYGKIFQKLTDFMGFTEGLCAMAEEPEEVYALFDYLCDFNIRLIKNLIKYYKPDAICIPDDTATARAPFISRKMYQDLVKPFHAKIGEVVLDAGLFLEMHDCGKCDDFIEDWLDFGVCAWNPAQSMNDLVGVKKQFGRKLVIAGGWNGVGPESEPEYDKDKLREKLIDYVDTLAPGGAFVFGAMINGDRNDPRVQERWDIVNDVYENYARNWYETHA